MMNQKNSDLDGLKDIIDNGTTYVNVNHIYKSGFFDNRPDTEKEDVCLKMLGEESEECIKHNARTSNNRNPC